MSGLILALLAALLAGLGARDQLMVAQIASVQGARPATLIVAIASCLATSAIAAWASLGVAPMLNGDARLFLAGLALAMAGGEALVLGPPRKPAEPTRSLFALAVVLAAQQLTDATRFLIFAVSLAAYAPVPAAAGGAVAGMVLLGAAWSAPDLVTWPRLRLARRVIGGLLLVAGAALAFSAVDFSRY